MEPIKVGYRVKLVSNSTGKDIGVEGILDRSWIPDEYPDCIIDGKHHDLTDEGDSYSIFKVLSLKEQDLVSQSSSVVDEDNAA